VPSKGEAFLLFARNKTILLYFVFCILTDLSIEISYNMYDNIGVLRQRVQINDYIKKMSDEI
jgi:hypothetical protein